MINQSFYIITGASKGLGRDIALKVSNSNSILLLIARNEVSLFDVAQKCMNLGATVYTILEDISDDNFHLKFNSIIELIELKHVYSFYLFNNASVIDPITKLKNISLFDQKRVININLTSSILLSSEFLRLIENFNNVASYIVNISSGVSLKAINGWSLYCISKAGINMLTSCIAEESKEKNLYTITINPGAMDTEMQKSIRTSDINEVPITAKFIKMHDEGFLNETSMIASKIINLLNNKNYPNGSFVDFNLIENIN
jgi:benzil reductase ((S)-benzoin forming)